MDLVLSDIITFGIYFYVTVKLPIETLIGFLSTRVNHLILGPSPCANLYGEVYAPSHIILLINDAIKEAGWHKIESHSTLFFASIDSILFFLQCSHTLDYTREV